MNEPDRTGVTSAPGALATGLLAVVYGLGVAFLPDLGILNSLWLWVGAAVVGVMFVVFLVIPFFRNTFH